MNHLYRKPTGQSSTSTSVAGLASDPKKWTREDVGTYLDLIELGDYKNIFRDQHITGADLQDLTNDDLMRLGMTRIGHRKQFQRKVADLAKQDSRAFRANHADDDDENNSDSEKDNKKEERHSRTASRSKLQVSTDQSIRIKSTYEDRTKLFSLSNVTFDRLRKELSKKWEIDSFLISYIDNDGDTIEITSDDDLEEIVKEVGSSTLRLLIRPKHKRNHITDAEKTLLEGIIEPVLVFSKTGRFVYRNSASTALGGANAFQMFPDIDIPHYINTGNCKYLNHRTMMEVRVGGQIERREVTLTENQTKNRHTFTATVHQKQTSTLAQIWSITYEHMKDVVIIIDSRGLIQFTNTAAVTVFGYKDLVGQNVKIIMPKDDAVKHDGYLRNFRRSGIAKVIGTGRTVIGQSSSGQLIPLHLTLIEQRYEGDQRFFIGMLRVLDLEGAATRTMLQTERETVESLSAPAIIIDSKANILFLNSKVEQLVGYKFIELINQNVNKLMPPEVAAKHDAYVSNYLKTGKSAIIGVGRDVMVRHKNGSDLPMSLYVTEKNDGDQTIFTGVFSQKERGNTSKHN